MNKSRKKEQKIQNILTFGQRLCKVRQDLGLNQDEFAHKLGFSANTIISRFEKDKSLPSVEVLLILARDYKIDLHWLLTGQYSLNTIEVVQTLIRVISGYLEVIYLQNSNLDFRNKELLSKKIIPIEDLPANKTLTREEFRDAERLQGIQDELKAGQYLYEELTNLQKIIKKRYIPPT